MRTVDEVRARVEAVLPRDPLGFETAILAGFVPALLKDPSNASPLTRDQVIGEMREYMPFAFEKALRHRAWLWLLGDDELVAFIDGDHYANYGVPVLKAVARKYAFPAPPEIERWADGEPCRPGCQAGCGL